MKPDAFARMHDSVHRNKDRKAVEFHVEEIRCCVDIMRVREIVSPGKTMPIPSAPHWVVGAADHRESVVPVADIRLRLGLESSKPLHPKWIIVDAGGMDMALLVDTVHGVVTVSVDLERERHPLMDGTDVTWVHSVYSMPEGLIFELDLDNMFDAQKNHEERPEDGKIT